MRIINILILLFIMSAFAIGIQWEDKDMPLMEGALDNASLVVHNLTFEKTGDQFMDGMLTILYEFIDFIGVSYVEVMRLGIIFGSENPEYFTPEFIITMMKLIVWLVVLSLLIQPLFYLVVFIIMIGVWAVDKFKRRKNEVA